MMDGSAPGVHTRRGDSGAFAEVAERYYARIYYHALSRCGNPWDAGDVTQNTFVKAYLNIGQLHDFEAVGAWLQRICDNEASRLFRERGAVAMPVERPKSDAGSGALDAAVGELSDKLRIAVMLKYYAGFSMREISVLTNVPESRVKSRLHDARRKLKENLVSSEWRNRPGRRRELMDTLKRMELGGKVLPCLSRWAQNLLLEDARAKRKFSEDALKELGRVDGGSEWVTACDGELSYDEFIRILACCDEPTIYRLSQSNYSSWGIREKTPLIRDIAKISDTGGYVESLEPIMLAPSLAGAVEWYKKHLGWSGCADDDYGYGQLYAYSSTAAENSAKTFSGFHMRKGEPYKDCHFFCFVVDVEALYARVKSSGWEKIGKVVDNGWGTKGFSCTDLNGYVLEFCVWLVILITH